MKINSGNTTTRIPFIAVDETDMLSRLAGLTAFTVYRNRNGEGAVVMTTPTVTEAHATNQTGLYWLLVDEDTTIDPGFIEQQMVLTIKHAGMYSVDMCVQLSHVGNLLPDALDNGFLKASIKRVGVTTIGPSGAGGQKYGG